MASNRGRKGSESRIHGVDLRNGEHNLKQRKEDEHMFNISYYKTEDTKVMVVTLHALKQTIILQPGYFYKISGVDRKVITGCGEFSGTILVDLGFVFPFKSDRKIV